MLLLLLLLQLYYRALFDHVSFEKGDVSAIFFFFAYYGKCDSADFLCNYQYSYLRSRCITFLLTFSFLFFFKVKCKSSTDLNVFEWPSSNRHTRQTLRLRFPSCKVSFMQSLMVFSPNELVFYFVLIPLNRLLVYEGSLYQLKNV